MGNVFLLSILWWRTWVTRWLDCISRNWMAMPFDFDNVLIHVQRLSMALKTERNLTIEALAVQNNNHHNCATTDTSNNQLWRQSCDRIFYRRHIDAAEWIFASSRNIGSPFHEHCDGNQYTIVNKKHDWTSIYIEERERTGRFSCA